MHQIINGSVLGTAEQKTKTSHLPQKPTREGNIFLNEKSWLVEQDICLWDVLTVKKSRPTSIYFDFIKSSFLVADTYTVTSQLQLQSLSNSFSRFLLSDSGSMNPCVKTNFTQERVMAFVWPIYM